jgi:hypothetical protein
LAAKDADCKRLLPDGFIFQHDSTLAHTARVMQAWLLENYPGFIGTDQWPQNSPDLNPLYYHVWGTMLEKYHELQPKPKTIAELKIALQLTWND